MRRDTSTEASEILSFGIKHYYFLIAIGIVEAAWITGLIFLYCGPRNHCTWTNSTESNSTWINSTAGNNTGSNSTASNNTTPTDVAFGLLIAIGAIVNALGATVLEGGKKNCATAFICGGLFLPVASIASIPIALINTLINLARLLITTVCAPCCNPVSRDDPPPPVSQPSTAHVVQVPADVGVERGLFVKCGRF